MFEFITVGPHVPRDVKELSDDLCGPSTGSFLTLKGFVMLCLGICPVCGEVSMEHGVPSDG